MTGMSLCTDDVIWYDGARIYTNEWMVYNHTNNNIEYDDACIIANKWTVYNYIQNIIIKYDGARKVYKVLRIDNIVQ